jgi:hypothetical protein
MSLNQSPILTLRWNDPETTAVGWLIIDSLVNNLTGGGCLMGVYLTENLIKNKAAHQSQKMALCNPPISKFICYSAFHFLKIFH